MAEMNVSVILWRIPRTGTTSLRHTAHQAEIPERKCLAWDATTPSLITYGHSTPPDVIARGLATAEQLCSVPNMIVVRNSWDRLVSMFHLFHQRGTGLDVIARRYGPTFPAYVEWCCRGERATGQHERNYQCRPQTEWLEIVEPEVFVFPDVARAWKRIAEHFGKEHNVLHVNGTKRRAYRDYYTAKLRGMVAKHYREEIERFGFAY